MKASLRLLTPEVGSAPLWPLRDGPAFTIGAEGDWSLGRGVLPPIVALAWFDGRSLLVAAAYEGAAVRIDGRPLGTSWTAADRHCRLDLGPIAIDFVPSRGATTVKGAKSAPFAKSVWSVAPAELLASVRRRAPFMIGGAAVAFTITLAVLRTSSAHEAHRASPALPPRAAAPTAVAAPSKPAASGVVVHPATHPPRRKLGKTEERLAADAFHAGDRRKAAALYAELAAENPANPAFATIARLLSP